MVPTKNSKINRTSNNIGEQSLLLATQVIAYEKSYNRGNSNRLSRRQKSPRTTKTKANTSQPRVRFDSMEKVPNIGVAQSQRMYVVQEEAEEQGRTTRCCSLTRCCPWLFRTNRQNNQNQHPFHTPKNITVQQMTRSTHQSGQSHGERAPLLT